jgi:hypothetical protein
MSWQHGLTRNSQTEKSRTSFFIQRHETEIVSQQDRYFLVLRLRFLDAERLGRKFFPESSRDALLIQTHAVKNELPSPSGMKKKVHKEDYISFPVISCRWTILLSRIFQLSPSYSPSTYVFRLPFNNNYYTSQPENARLGCSTETRKVLVFARLLFSVECFSP